MNHIASDETFVTSGWLPIEFRMIIAILFLLFPCLTGTCYAGWDWMGSTHESSTGSTWNLELGGSDADYASAIVQTKDGGYLLSGSTQSFGLGPWLIKLDAGGNVRWQKVFHGGMDSSDQIYSIQQTRDGGFIAAGSADQRDGQRGWLLKIDSNGITRWQKLYRDKLARSSADEFNSVQQTTDGGYVVAGATSFFNQTYDLWVLKLDANGNVQWKRAYGGSKADIGSVVRQTGDGGFIVGGITSSFGITGNGYDLWIIKLNSQGRILWQMAYGGDGDDVLSALEPTQDGGYIVGGFSNSFGTGKYDCWLLKLDSVGSIQWQRVYAKGSDAGVPSVQQASDGGYIVADGVSFVTNPAGAIVFKISADGDLEWKKVYGVSRAAGAAFAAPAPDGGYIISGGVDSPQRDSDILVIKTDKNGTSAMKCEKSPSNVYLQIRKTFAKVTLTSAQTAITPLSVTTGTPQTISTNAKPHRICASK